MVNCTKHVQRWNRRQTTCDCGLIPYKHREGSPGCQEHPDTDPWGSRYGSDER